MGCGIADILVRETVCKITYSVKNYTHCVNLYNASKTTHIVSHNVMYVKLINPGASHCDSTLCSCVTSNK